MKRRTDAPRRRTTSAVSNAKPAGSSPSHKGNRAKIRVKKGPAARRSRLRKLKKRTRAGNRPSSKRLHRQPLIALPAALELSHEDLASVRESAYHDGYERGVYEGGELLLEQSTPAQTLLPEVSLQEVIAAGVEMLRPRCYSLMDVHEVYAEMDKAIQLQRPCSVVRLGDGELLALSQEVVYDSETIKREGGFLPYAGVHPPDLNARDQLALAVSHAQIVGVPMSRMKHFQPLLYPVLRSHGIDPGSLHMTYSTINYSLNHAGLLSRLLQGRRLLLIGNAAPALARVFVERGFIVSGIINPVNGFADIDRVMREVRETVFDLALVSAGIPAVIISYRIAMERGKVAMDFGHMADSIVKGEAVL
ncbi:hypothetical protein Back11_00310 [Paenibacillus baekrokdamisoli]|uniref:GT-D fold-like domain-containing protein n=1 Tax=Paenibacillus baekrokdamisoli TaxID=1712516 RepID=A0A3G9IK78_9BACL|nr:GT-D fold domain-containing glycosyltransferase [Paenibacillus baekrokdamisoli]MBB3069344.1 hypothetical protein [Paenibacillus baekrokdamisoli]BBH18686.1 hypothetical protein Back11_00310 [Paenibacillus baekrokdamisoli]